MKEATLRTPDEGELWLNGNNAGYYAVINGRFVRVGMAAIHAAPNAQVLKRDLDDFFNPKATRGMDHPKTEGVFNIAIWRLYADSYKDELESVVIDKLNDWSNHIGGAAKSLSEELAR